MRTPGRWSHRLFSVRQWRLPGVGLPRLLRGRALPPPRVPKLGLPTRRASLPSLHWPCRRRNGSVRAAQIARGHAIAAAARAAARRAVAPHPTGRSALAALPPVAAAHPRNVAPSTQAVGARAAAAAARLPAKFSASSPAAGLTALPAQPAGHAAPPRGAALPTAPAIRTAQSAVVPADAATTLLPLRQAAAREED
jgi:hypothetical protein